MKILFWTDGFWPQVGGLETQGLQFIEGMQERGHLFTVLAHAVETNFKESEIYKGIPIRRFAFDIILAKQDLKTFRRLREYIERVLNEFQPDLVHLNLSGWSALAFILLKNAFRIPAILTIHIPFSHRDKIPPSYHELFASVDQICCVSGWIVQEVGEHMPSAREKTRLIYNGLAMTETIPTPPSFSTPVLLLLGRLLEEKGFDAAIEAFSLLKKRGSNARLLIAGDGRNRMVLVNLVARLELGESVQFMGEVARDHVPSVINRADIVIIPSYFEPFGLVALEAMQLGRPVIASRVGGLQEVVSDGETGILVPAHDPVALAAAMEDLIAHPEKAIQMGLNGRRRAMEKFTLDQHVAQYESVYEELVGARR